MALSTLQDSAVTCVWAPGFFISLLPLSPPVLSCLAVAISNLPPFFDSVCLVSVGKLSSVHSCASGRGELAVKLLFRRPSSTSFSPAVSLAATVCAASFLVSRASGKHIIRARHAGTSTSGHPTRHMHTLQAQVQAHSTQQYLMQCKFRRWNLRASVHATNYTLAPRNATERGSFAVLPPYSWILCARGQGGETGLNT